MALLTFPSSPSNGQLYPTAPLPGQNQYEWESATQTWRLLGAATGVVPGCYGDAFTVPTFCVDAQGRLTSVTNVAIAANIPDLQQVTTEGAVTTDIIDVGGLIAAGLTYPNVDGVANDVLVTDGAGNLSFSTLPTETLQSVTTAGNTTTNAIDVGGLTAAGLIYPLVDGVSGDYLTTDGAGNLSWLTPSATPDLQTVTDAGTTTTDTIDVGGLIAASLTYPTVDGAAGDYLTTDGAGLLSWVTPPTTPDLDAVTTAGNTTLNSIDVGGLTAAGLTYPFVDGAAGDFLTTDGAGTLSWVVGGTVTSVTAGTGLTGGTITSSGTIALDPTAIISPAIFTAKGSLIGSSGASSPSELSVGSDGQFLSVDSTTTTGLKWVTLAPGGVTSVTGTAPISSSGGATPDISITPATTTAAGSMSAADKVKVDALPATVVGSVAGASPIVSSGGATPTISITAATTTAAGSMSAADKVKVDALPATIVSTVGGTSPIVSSGGTTPTISITAATTTAAGSMSAADKVKVDALPATIVSTVTGTAPIASSGGTTPAISITPGTARQLMQTNAAGTAAEFTSNVDIPGTLDVTGISTFDSKALFSTGSAGSPSISVIGDTDTGVYFPTAGATAITANGTEIVRATPGTFFVNDTAQRDLGGQSFQVSGWSMFYQTLTGVSCSVFTHANSGTQTVCIFRQGSPAATVGSITVNSGLSTSYNTLSDYRLKENVIDLDNATERLKQIPVHRFNFTVNPDIAVDGFLAHEVQEVVPEAITGTKDEVDEDGNPVYQGIDQSKLVPLLTAALKEAISKIEELESKLENLEKTLNA